MQTAAVYFSVFTNVLSNMIVTGHLIVLQNDLILKRGQETATRPASTYYLALSAK